MESTNWLRQAKEPLFPDVLWSRPENRRQAGKLLIIGGDKQNFSAVSEAYSAALKAGIGTGRVLLPDSLQKTLSAVFPEAEFVPSTPIGSFSRQALDSLLEAAEWADGVLLAGDFGRNSETAVLLESFAEKYIGRRALAGDSLDYFFNQPGKLLDRPDTLIVTDFSRLQRLIQSKVALKHSDDLAQILNKSSIFTSGVKSNFITVHSGQIIVAGGGRASTTPLKGKDVPMGDIAAYAIVWWLQQPKTIFESLTSAVWHYEHSDI